MIRNPDCFGFIDVKDLNIVTCSGLTDRSRVTPRAVASLLGRSRVGVRLGSTGHPGGALPAKVPCLPSVPP